MANFILRAPDAELRTLEDYRHECQEHSYTETVDVKDGIAKCNDVPTKDMLVGKGYKLVDSSLICPVCGFVALSKKEFDEHSLEHDELNLTAKRLKKKSSVKLVCSICEAVFEKEEDLLKHRFEHVFEKSHL